MKHATNWLQVRRVIDLLEKPVLAKGDELIGDLSDAERVQVGLQIRPASEAA